MIPVIGLVICAYIVAQMVNIATDKTRHDAARLFAVLALGVAIIGGVLLWRIQGEVQEAANAAESAIPYPMP
jgi:hypothetical protein